MVTFGVRARFFVYSKPEQNTHNGELGQQLRHNLESVWNSGDVGLQNGQGQLTALFSITHHKLRHLQTICTTATHFWPTGLQCTCGIHIVTSTEQISSHFSSLSLLKALKVRKRQTNSERSLVRHFLYAAQAALGYK